MDYPHQDLTRRIIAAAITVHKELRPGLDEKFYERALCIEFAEMGINFDQQKRFPVEYKSRFLGNLIPDLVVEDSVIVDPKYVDSFTPAHEAQMLGYLSITGLDVALPLNFKTWPLGKKESSVQAINQIPPPLLCDLIFPLCLCGKNKRN